MHRARSWQIAVCSFVRTSHFSADRVHDIFHHVHPVRIGKVWIFSKLQENTIFSAAVCIKPMKTLCFFIILIWSRIFKNSHFKTKTCFVYAKQCFSKTCPRKCLFRLRETLLSKNRSLLVYAKHNFFWKLRSRLRETLFLLGTFSKLGRRGAPEAPSNSKK